MNACAEVKKAYSDTFRNRGGRANKSASYSCLIPSADKMLAGANVSRWFLACPFLPCIRAHEVLLHKNSPIV
jgi:hypothetical protein